MINKEIAAKSIAANVADYMMLKDGITVWGGLHNPYRDGADMIATPDDFETSLVPVVEKIMMYVGTPTNGVELSELERVVKGLVTSVWEVVWLKWSFAFTDYKRHKEEYILLNAKGVYAIHMLLADCVNFFDDDGVLPQVINGAESNFRKVIAESDVTETDWLTAGTFWYLLGEEGYATIVKILQDNELLKSQRAIMLGNVVDAWEETTTIEYESKHICVEYNGDTIPEYKVVRHPDGGGWTIVRFDVDVEEYLYFNENMVFESEVTAKNYVNNLA